MVIWKYFIFDLFQQVVIANYNDGIMKPLADIDRNGLEYHSPVNFKSIDIHFIAYHSNTIWVVYHGPIW